MSHKKISRKPDVVYCSRIINGRFNYARRVNEMPDEDLWFLDESVFNLNVSISCAGPVSAEPQSRVRPNRGVNVSLLIAYPLNELSK